MIYPFNNFSSIFFTNQREHECNARESYSHALRPPRTAPSSVTSKRRGPEVGGKDVAHGGPMAHRVLNLGVLVQLVFNSIQHPALLVELQQNLRMARLLKRSKGRYRAGASSSNRGA